MLASWVEKERGSMANDRFDKEAAAWDSNPTTVKSSKLAFGSLLEHVPDLADDDKAKGRRSPAACATNLISRAQTLCLKAVRFV
jgi:hypothetical protein